MSALGIESKFSDDPVYAERTEGPALCQPRAQPWESRTSTVLEPQRGGPKLRSHETWND